MSFEDEYRTDPVTGRKDRHGVKSKLNSKERLRSRDMDEIFALETEALVAQKAVEYDEMMDELGDYNPGQYEDDE